MNLTRITTTLNSNYFSNLRRLFCGRGKLRSTSRALDKEYIKSKTVLSNDHLTPELSLHLITPECDLWYAQGTENKFENDPFWGIYWPGGQALSRYILDNKAIFASKNVVDIGSGCGACAIAAAKSGARIVMANDTDNLSLTAIELNSKVNGIEIFLENTDIIGSDIDSVTIETDCDILKPKWDVVLVGDMFYDSDFGERLFSWLCDLKKKGKTVLIGDPMRYVMKDILKTGKVIKVAEYSPNYNEHFGFCTYSVWMISDTD